MTDQTQSSDERIYAPAGVPRRLSPTAPLRWLALGWRDLRRAPLVSLSYGAALVAAGYLLAGLAWLGGQYILLFSLVTGLLLVGPVLAFGLYDISRQLETRQKPSLRHGLQTMRESLGQELVFAVVILVIMLVWARAANVIHAFFPAMADPSLQDLALFLGVGCSVGALFAIVVFSVSVVSLPMMMDRDADVITAAITSVRTVLANPVTMLVWGALIVLTAVLGFATAMLGLAVGLPLIGHASWHAYREALEPWSPPA
jgi:uncharacterized membrane protein